MTQREKSSIGMLMIVVFSAMLLWALTATVWPVPVVYADDPEIITITVTSNLETFFYDPGLDPMGGTVYFNSVGGEGAGQVLTVTVTCSGTVQTFEGASAFDDPPPTDFSAPWQLIYTVEEDAGTQSGIVFTVTNASGTDTAVITFTQDNTDPTIISPTIIEGSMYLHADGLTVYYGDDMGISPRTFRVQGNAQDSGVGLYYAAYSAALNQGDFNDFIYLAQWRRDYTADQDNTTSGVITATIYDRVGNFATQTFNYTRDIVNPNISDPFIAENSPYLHANGTTVYYSDQMGGTAQSFTVRGNAADNGVGLHRATFSSALGSSPDPDYDPTEWSGTYDVDSNDNGPGTITVRVYDNVSNWSQQTFNYIEDTTAPTIELTDVTDPGYDYDPDWGEPLDKLDTDGSNWYNADNFAGEGGGWVFTYTVSDSGSGPSLAGAVWDHSTDNIDRFTDPGIDDGRGVFTDVVNDGDGTVTVTLTITDHVGNWANDTVVFKIDNTGPTITSPSIKDYGSPWLHVDSLTVYYGDDMIGPEAFTVHGSSNDTGVGLGDVDFSYALGSKPTNQGTLADWIGKYTAASWDTDSGTIMVTVSDLLGNATYQTFNYIRDTEPPTVEVNCPTVTSEPSWSVSWSARDLQPASGENNHFDVQYKVGSDGQWQDWYMNTILTQTTFGPTSPIIVEDGETYYFQVGAKDNVSNEQHGECETTYLPGVKEVFLPIIMKDYCDPESYEYNDSCEQAYGPLTSGQVYQSWISSCDQATYKKSDYFYIVISTTNAIEIKLTNIPEGTNYDLYLYTKYPCDPDNRVGKPKPGTSPETILYSPPVTGTYYIRVYGLKGFSASPYSLRVTYD